MAKGDVVLLIKGGFEEARKALDARSLQTVQALSCQAMVNGEVNSVKAFVHALDIDTVRAWFNEPTGGLTPGIGYQPGTLLYYHVEH